MLKLGRPRGNRARAHAAPEAGWRQAAEGIHDATTTGDDVYDGMAPQTRLARGAGWRSVRYKRTVSLEFTCTRARWLLSCAGRAPVSRNMSALNPRSPSGPEPDERHPRHRLRRGAHRVSAWRPGRHQGRHAGETSRPGACDRGGMGGLLPWTPGAAVAHGPSRMARRR